MLSKCFTSFIFGVFAFIMTEQRNGREKEAAGSGKVLEPGFELGTPVAQWRYILHFLNKNQLFVCRVEWRYFRLLVPFEYLLYI